MSQRVVEPERMRASEYENQKEGEPESRETEIGKLKSWRKRELESYSASVSLRAKEPKARDQRQPKAL
jgi:hypothetical protein